MEQNKEVAPWDVVVIGAGIAGLTASIYLARAGQKVLLLDKGAQPGGRAATQAIADARVNLGAHALYKSTLPILREVGVTPTGASPKPTSAFVFRGLDGKDEAVPFFKLLLGSFLKWSEKTELIRFYAGIRKTDTSALSDVSLQSYLETHISSPRVRDIALALVRVSTYCHAPALLSAGAVLEQLKQAQVLYVNEGWQTLVNQLTEQAKLAGVTIRSQVLAREIAGAYPQMTVILKDGERLSARRVLSTAGPADTLVLLNPALLPAEAASYERLVPVRAACLDLVVSGLPQPRTKFALGADSPLYYSNHSAVASFTDNPKHAVVHLMKYLSPTQNSDAAQDERELESFLDLLQPGWRDYVIQRRYLPRMLVSHAIVTAADGGLAGRPGPIVEGRTGLYVAGDWVGSEGILLNASLTSAKAAAQCIITHIEQGQEGNYLGA
ncbi:phytoene desaturase family protein [Cohnella yongneupensis]|uniref:Phytoene desaturase family protein n=1 Tax=Cohnella yongneupensis TaxID=425006 RepID=A0ABW0QV36_9BACL